MKVDPSCQFCPRLKTQSPISNVLWESPGNQFKIKALECVIDRQRERWPCSLSLFNNTASQSLAALQVFEGIVIALDPCLITIKTLQVKLGRFFYSLGLCLLSEEKFSLLSYASSQCQLLSIWPSDYIGGVLNDHYGGAMIRRGLAHVVRLD